MYKTITILLTAVALAVHAETFNLGTKKNPAKVSVEKQGDSLRIACRFISQKKFSPDVNARFNDRKANDICQKGVVLYLRVPRGKSVNLSGISSAAPHKDFGKEVEYYFQMQCPVIRNQQPLVKTAAAVAKPPVTAAVAKPPVTAAVAKPPVTAAVAKPPVTAAVAKPPVKKQVTVHRQKSSLTVIRYCEQDGVVNVVESREYTASEFKDQQSFDNFCKEHYARIARDAEKNMMDILDRFEKERRRISGEGK